MSFWIFIWKIVLILGLLVFTGMAVWVTIGGFKDIKKMLSLVDKTHDEL